MISPEALRRYPFFAQLDPKQLANLAMITEEIRCEDGETIFRQHDRAENLYFLMEGCVDLYYTIQEAYLEADQKEALVCQINPGEIFGISTLIPPHEMTSSARSTNHSRIMEIDGSQLKELFDQDREMGFLLMRRVAKAALLRLDSTRIQLAAAWEMMGEPVP
jgi:CRP/FNR family cyclic AMP-dependent transcriptional regulator